MGAVLSLIQIVLAGRQGKCVPMCSLLNPAAVRRTEIEIYLPSVLSNIVLHYFSKQSIIQSDERIYNRIKNNDGETEEQVWELDSAKEFSCTLTKTIVLDEQGYIETKLRCRVAIQDNGQSLMHIHLCKFYAFKNNRKKNPLNLCSTVLVFVVIHPLCYDLDGISDVHCLASDDYCGVFVEWLKFLDDGILEFNHSLLIHIKSLIEAHKHHPNLTSCASCCELLTV